MKSVAKNSSAKQKWRQNDGTIDPHNPPPLTDWQRKQIEEGIKAADRGDFVSEKEMKAFFAKWRSRCKKK